MTSSRGPGHRIPNRGENPTLSTTKSWNQTYHTPMKCTLKFFQELSSLNRLAVRFVLDSHERLGSQKS
ncbi:hypothetical protein HYDPIDRAFT_118034 [Hydnomerulius pinastri MD-312]|uniref:Uncharacterized protein n=1 Tax=Hydnomerulius pinastri MD-312 TaxID=994086 RepID=A0A0C9VQB5_9AGAM|nr:hypothetical protein HYDPIDRAFT_118034 [Hydnomerulius pinastri MD-312]